MPVTQRAKQVAHLAFAVVGADVHKAARWVDVIEEPPECRETRRGRYRHVLYADSDCRRIGTRRRYAPRSARVPLDERLDGRVDLVGDDDACRLLGNLRHQCFEHALFTAGNQLVDPGEHDAAQLLQLERRALHECEELGWRAGNDLGAATSCHVAANQPRRATRRRGRDRAQRSTPGEPNDGCGRARGRLGICAYDQQLDIVQCVIDPLEDGREDLSDRGPVVRHLVDDVLPTRHSWLSCFVIHFTLDCALATLWHTDLPVPSIAGPTSIAVSGTPTKSSVDSATTAPFAHFAHDVRTLYTFRQ